jgi:hypothetical protein
MEALPEMTAQTPREYTPVGQSSSPSVSSQWALSFEMSSRHT